VQWRPHGEVSDDIASQVFLYSGDSSGTQEWERSSLEAGNRGLSKCSKLSTVRNADRLCVIAIALCRL
jgi:hypothetical protein